MSIPFWCVLISAVMIYLSKLPVGKAQAAEKGGYDNSNPRAQQARLTGLGARALAAHQNGFEIFPLFAAGVLMAHVSGASGVLADALAVTFVVSRVLYIACYWVDLSWQRSLIWALGLFCCLGLMLIPAFV
jgi:uncharacterized MAPEG superfamily protein